MATASLSKDPHYLDRWFISPPMFRRDRRLREARVNADRCQRELRRDRLDVERKERLLLGELRKHAQNGDLHKARTLATQIAHYRAVCDRNFESAVMIDTRAQLMVSNHVVNRAEVEAIKGARYANQEEDLKKVMKREIKYERRLVMYENMESLMNEGMDDVYEWGESQRPRTDSFPNEVDGVVRQAVQVGWGKEYFERESPMTRAGVTLGVQGTTPIHLRLFRGKPTVPKSEAGSPSHPPSYPPSYPRTSLTSNTASKSADQGKGKEKEKKAALENINHFAPPAAARPPLGPSWSCSGSPSAFTGSTQSLVSDVTQPVSQNGPSDLMIHELASMDTQALLPEAIFDVPTLDISVDMLATLIARSGVTMRQLELQQWHGRTSVRDIVFGFLSKFRLGGVQMDGSFMPFSGTLSLQQLGVAPGGTIWVAAVADISQQLL